MPRRWLAILAAVSMLNTTGTPLRAQPAPPPLQQPTETEQFDVQQIDALLAPIALYPDQLLTQILIASTFPIQIVEASRWIDDPTHKDLSGDALAKALEPLGWDPSVKSLVPFPQVLSQLNNNLEWTQQLGYAFASQQKDVLDSVQRLRRQAQEAGHLQSTSQQVVRTEAQSGQTAQPTIVIAPAQPNVVYVPAYSPAAVYGAWPYPAYPPVVAAPAPGYVVGTALLGGLAFGAGVAITASLWGWSSPNWYRGNVNVNVNRWNNINVNHQRVTANAWSPTWNRAGGRPTNLQRAPAGPVGRPVRSAGLPANAIGRRDVAVSGGLVSHPVRPNPGTVNAANRPNLTPGSRPTPSPNRPRLSGQGQASRPALQNRQGGAGPGQAGGGQRFQPRGEGRQRPEGAFGGMNQGGRAGSFGQRGAQSRQTGGFHPRPPSGGVNRGGARGGVHGRR
jgi:hypothetical protein